MKKLYIILVILVCASYVSSQEIVESNKLWSIMEEHCQPWGSNYSTEFFRFEGDTLVDDLVYKKVLISEDENHENWNFYGAFIREESGLVYYKQMYGDEGLIYNFNLEIGDSVVIDNPRAAGALTLQLIAIDSIELEQGYRERWKLSNSVYPDFEYWIRGIGSETGVINSSTGVYGGLCGLFTLLCEKENDSLLYLNSEVGSCFVYITDIEKNNDNIADLFLINYNIGTKSMQIKMIDSNSRTLLISSLKGEIIAHQQLNSNTFSIDLSNCQTGVYFVSLIEEGSLVTKKIFVN